MTVTWSLKRPAPSCDDCQGWKVHDCPDCDGAGEITGTACETCDGSGEVECECQHGRIFDRTETEE